MWPVGATCPAGTTPNAPSGGVDGDDTDDTRSPTLAEVCEGSIDEDCDGFVDEGLTLECWTDADSDTFTSGVGPELLCPVMGVCPGARTTRTPADGVDCDDTDDAISPVAGETCDGEDQDCDGRTDEGTQIDCYLDSDSDDYAALGTGATPLRPAPVGGGPPGHASLGSAG